MPTAITRHEVQRLIRNDGALIIEVLPAQEYEDEHIAGAINIPLKRLDRESVSHLDRAQPIIFY